MVDETLNRLLARFLPTLLADVRAEVAAEPVAYFTADAKIAKAPAGLGAAANTLTVDQLLAFAQDKQQQCDSLRSVAEANVPGAEAAIGEINHPPETEAAVSSPLETTAAVSQLQSSLPLEADTSGASLQIADANTQDDDGGL